jgi:MoxR-like ATPase
MSSAPGATAPDQVRTFVELAEKEIGKVIIGQRDLVRHCFAALLVGGHVLLEGVPGVAKTLAVKTVAQLLQLQFQRVQCTSDLMPADILGTNILNQATSSFQLHRGPIFGDLLLVDEINRMPPRTQAALLEAMEERQVTIDGKRYSLHPTFTVFATQNPVDFEGTYPLPEAQLDRFLLKCVVDYPSQDEEVQILQWHSAQQGSYGDVTDVVSVPTEALEGARAQVRGVRVESTVHQYVARLARATRQAGQVTLGASPRAAISLLFVSKALAAMDGRDYVIPDDVKQAAVPVLRHRILLTPEAQLEGLTPDQALHEIIKSVELPK